MKNIELNTKAISYQNIKMNTGNIIFRYPNLTKIPETDFTCDGRKGMFADIETNCQVRIYILNIYYIFFCILHFKHFIFIIYFILQYIFALEYELSYFLILGFSQLFWLV